MKKSSMTDYELVESLLPFQVVIPYCNHPLVYFVMCCVCKEYYRIECVSQKHVVVHCFNPSQ